MKYLVLVLMIVGLSGCGVEWASSVPDAYYGSSTTIGIDAGLPEGLHLVIGYKKHEGLICRNETDARIVSESEATANGLNTRQLISFGEGVTVHESRDSD